MTNPTRMGARSRWMTLALGGALFCCGALPSAGAAATLNTTERISVAPSGVGANEDSEANALSGDGRYVVFQSSAANLVPGDTNGAADIFVRDRQTGAIQRASVGSGGGQAPLPSFAPAISADGRLIAFHTSAGLSANDTNDYPDIYLRDRQTGTTSLVPAPEPFPEEGYAYPVLRDRQGTTCGVMV